VPELYLVQEDDEKGSVQPVSGIAGLCHSITDRRIGVMDLVNEK
jgi:hypothetical protein